MLYYDTVEEYDEEIASVRTAIRRISAIGQKTENNSGGSSAKMEDADLEQLEKYLIRLRQERQKLLTGFGGMRMGLGW